MPDITPKTVAWVALGGAALAYVALRNTPTAKAATVVGPSPDKTYKNPWSARIVAELARRATSMPDQDIQDATNSSKAGVLQGIGSYACRLGTVAGQACVTQNSRFMAEVIINVEKAGLVIQVPNKYLDPNTPFDDVIHYWITTPNKTAPEPSITLD